MQIVFFSGRRVALRPRDIVTLLKEPAVLVFIAIAIFISFYVNPHDDVRQMQVLPRLALILSTATVNLVALILPVALCAPLWTRLWTLPLPSLLPIVVSAVVTEVFSRWVMNTFYALPISYMAGFATALGMNLVMLFVFDLIFSLFVLPSTRWFANRRVIAPVQTDIPRIVRIAGQGFPLQEVMVIEAEEHYVRLRLEAREVLLRETFSTVVSQLDGVHGVQTHRSFWVNFAFVDRLVVDRAGQAEIRLQNGELIPVARRRRKECEQMLRQVHALA